MKEATPVFYGTINEGKLALENKERLKTYLASLPPGKRYKLIIRRWRNNRSDNQNGYYWGVVIKALSDATGFTSDEMHEAMKLMFLRRKEEVQISVDGKIKFIVMETADSTANMDTLQFEDYVEGVRRWASQELGVYIPAPNEEGWEYN